MVSLIFKVASPHFHPENPSLPRQRLKCPKKTSREIIPISYFLHYLDDLPPHEKSQVMEKSKIGYPPGKTKHSTWKMDVAMLGLRSLKGKQITPRSPSIPSMAVSDIYAKFWGVQVVIPLITRHSPPKNWMRCLLLRRNELFIFGCKCQL